MTGTTEHGARPAARLRVALGEYDTGWHDPAGSLGRAAGIVAAGARAGARLVVLPEMCTTGFTMEPGAWAEPLDGASGRALAGLAREHGVWIVAGLALRDPNETRPVNAAVMFDPAGSVDAIYRKQRLFAYAGEHEKYAPGEASVVTSIDGVRLGLFVCYDLRFPELFRAVAPEIDAAVLVANWPARRRMHWDVLTQARAIENQCYVIAVNRTGVGDDVVYDGGSAAYDPWGEPLCNAGAEPTPRSGPCVVDVDAERVRQVRTRYPFLRDLEPLLPLGARQSS